MRHRGFVFLGISIALQTASLAFGKQAALQMREFTVDAVAGNVNYLLSLSCLGAHAITWQLTIERLPLAHAYAMMSIVLANVLLLSVFVFHEPATRSGLAGACFVVAGVILVALGRPREDR
jgi:drug/metabolite transporter (DMT)-like permease